MADRSRYAVAAAIALAATLGWTVWRRASPRLASASVVGTRGTAGPGSNALPTAAPPSTLSGALDRGRSIYQGICIACHGGTTDKTPIPNLFDCVWRHDPHTKDALIDLVTRGVPGTQMLGFDGRLSESDIHSVVAYVLSASQCKTAP